MAEQQGRNNLYLGLDQQNLDFIDESSRNDHNDMRWMEESNLIRETRFPVSYVALLEGAYDYVSSEEGQVVNEHSVLMQDRPINGDLYNNREDNISSNNGHPTRKRRASDYPLPEVSLVGDGSNSETVHGSVMASATINHHPIMNNAARNGDEYEYGFGQSLQLNGAHIRAEQTENVPRNVRQRRNSGEHNFGSVTSLWNWNNSRGPRSTRPIASSSPRVRQRLHPSLGFARFASNAVNDRNMGFNGRRFTALVPSRFGRESNSMNTNLLPNQNVNAFGSIASTVRNFSYSPNLLPNYGIGGLQGERMVNRVVTQTETSDIRQLQYAASLTPYLNLMGVYDQRVAEAINRYEARWSHNHYLPFALVETQEMEDWIRGHRNYSVAPQIAETLIQPAENLSDSFEPESQSNDANTTGTIYEGVPENSNAIMETLLDIDNMSYEELLALSEQIGNIANGLSEEAILTHLRLKKYKVNEVQSTFNFKLCCVCQEDYVNGETLGKLDCEHDFHADCIKQWLVQKNSCPICKKTALAAAEGSRLF